MAGRRISRRAVVVALGGSMATRITIARGQVAEPVIGFLVLPARVPPAEPYFAAFEKALAEGGFLPGKAVTIQYRYANNRADQLRSLAQEIATAGASIVVTPSGSPAIQAAQERAPKASIVAIFTSDPVQSGLITSLNRPGGNITGAIIPGVQILEKQLELAHQLLPGKARVGVLVDSAFADPVRNRIGSVAEKLGLDLVIAVVANDSEIDAAFGSFARTGVQCVVVPWMPLLVTRHEQIVALAAANRLPDIYAPSDALLRGGLMSYGSAFPEMWRLLGVQTAKVLAGANPGELPVEFPTRIELRINLKVARERGIAIPTPVLTRADDIIE